MAPNRLSVNQYDGEHVRFVKCGITEASDRADDMVDQLFDEGWQLSDACWPRGRTCHDRQKHRPEVGSEHYWDSFWDADQVFYGIVLGFKGLERPAIVLAINDRNDMEQARERLYVGLSRPRDLLVVCADLAHIEEDGGADVLRHLRGR